MIDIAKTFEEFCKSIRLDQRTFDSSLKEITKKLNKHYYDTDSDIEHLYVVGSVGRGTAVDGVSDVDVIYDLPQEVYERFDGYEGNGQSALLQDVKDVLKERYPKTEIKGDGQVVSIGFDKFTVELVPGFKQTDGDFVYPDTHDGGSWKVTRPKPEQNACRNRDRETGGTFVHVSNMLRIWKNHWGFKFAGLLIDTMAYNYFSSLEEIKPVLYKDYNTLCTKVFKYLSEQDADRECWFAPGSNQQVDNCDNGAFIRKAEKAFKKLDSAESDDDKEDALRKVFGRKFSKCVVQQGQNAPSGYDFSSPVGEQFIEDRFPVDIRYNLGIDCKVTQNGFRPFRLSELLGKPKEKRWLSQNKNLCFFIDKTDVPEPYDVYWKVRNVGPEAERRKLLRGTIFRGHKSRNEHTDFTGPHYVECYIVKSGICVARDRIAVPIDVSHLDTEHME